MLVSFLCGEKLLTHPILTYTSVLHIPYWLCFYVGSFSYTSRAGFVFISGEFLLHIPCRFHFLGGGGGGSFSFFSMKDRWGRGGGGAGRRAFRTQSVTDRGPNVVNGYKLFIKSLENPSCSSWPPQWSNRAFYACFPRQSNIYFKTLFLSVPSGIDHRRFTAGIKLFHTGIVHAHISPRLVAGLQAVLYIHCEKFCQFHQVSRSSPICSVCVLCHSVHTHSSNAHTLAQHCMQVYSSPRWQLQWEAF